MVTESMMREDLQILERSHHHQEIFNARMLFRTVLLQGNRLAPLQTEIHPPFLEVEIHPLVAVLQTEENLHLVEIEIQNYSPRKLVQGTGIPSKGRWALVLALALGGQEMSCLEIWEVWEVQGILNNHLQDLETCQLPAQEIWDPETWDRPVDRER